MRLSPFAVLPFALGIVLFSSPAYSRPEYAVKTGSSCIACHVAPWGGGPRTVYGKIFGAKGETPGKYSTQDLFSASLRTISYYPTQKTAQRANGTALMEASGSVNVPVIEASEHTSELRGVLTYNMAPLGAGAREAYLRYSPNDLPNPLPGFLIVGRFNAPFGLLTDEHRTYTRLQTNMTLNQFNTGIAFSGMAVPSLSYDLALVNDFQSGGLFTSNDITWGAVFNLRWMPSFAPLLIGFSQNYERTLMAPPPYATSFYAAFSFDRVTQNKIPVQLLLEHVIAKNWNNPTYNPSIGSTFVPASDAAYLSAVQTSQSTGYYGELRYDLIPRLSLLYKFDYLTLASNYTADAFVRHGFGFEANLNSNIILDCRYEKASVGRPELVDSTAYAAQDDVIAMLRLWL